MKYLLSVLLIAFTPLYAAEVYFGTGGGDAKGIYQAQFDTQTGKLSDIRLAAEVGSPGFLALAPDQQTLYAVARTDDGPSVVAYRIRSNGDLQLLNSEPINDGGAAHIALHPSGKFLLTAQYGGGSVALFPLASDGRVQPRAQLVKHQGAARVHPNRQEGPHPHWVGFSPDGRFALVPDLGLDQIVIYKIDLDNPTLEKVSTAHTVPGGGPRHMRFSPDGKFIYLLNELTLSVTTFAFDPTDGSTERLSTTPTLTEETKQKESFNSASEIVVHPNGRFIYTGNRGNDSVTAFYANPETGQLSVIEVEPIRGSWPRNINLDPSAQWLLAAGARSNTVSIFRIDPLSGELTFPQRAVYSVPNVICILFRE